MQAGFCLTTETGYEERIAGPLLDSSYHFDLQFVLYACLSPVTLAIDRSIPEDGIRSSRKQC